MTFIRALSYLTITGLLTVCTWAQGTSGVKWTRIEANGEVSIAVPQGFLVDGEKSSTGKTHRIFASAGTTSIEMIFRDQSKFKGKITSPATPPEGVEVFTAEGLRGTRSCSAPGNRVSCVVTLRSDHYSYDLTVESLSEKPEIAKTFLASIMAKGKLVFLGEAASVSETVQLSQLFTSPEVTAALGRKQIDPVRVTQNRLAEYIAGGESPGTIVPAVILEKPFPEKMEQIIRSQPPNFGKKREGNDIVVRGAWAKVTFLANGQIGDVAIYSDEKKSYIEDCVEAIKKIKFIPAREGGKAVDSVQAVNYTMNFL